MEDVQQFDLSDINDDAFVATDTAAPKSVLSSLRDELKKQLESEDLDLPVPNRPNMHLLFNTNIDSYQTQIWRKRASDKQMPDGVDGLKFACTVIANQCVGVKYEGVLVKGGNGQTLTFRDKELLDMMGDGGALRAVDAVRWIYGRDAHIYRAVEEIFKAAGYAPDDDEAEYEDPTLLS